MNIPLKETVIVIDIGNIDGMKLFDADNLTKYLNENIGKYSWTLKIYNNADTIKNNYLLNSELDDFDEHGEK